MTTSEAIFYGMCTVVGLLLFGWSRRIRARREAKGPEHDQPSARKAATSDPAVEQAPSPWPYTQAALRKINRRPGTDDEKAIYYVAQLIGYLKNQGLDDFISATRNREWGLQPFVLGLQRVDASKVIPFLERAELEYDRYLAACDAVSLPIGSPEGQLRVKEHLGRMHGLEDELRSTGMDLTSTLETFAERLARSATN